MHVSSPLFPEEVDEQSNWETQNIVAAECNLVKSNPTQLVWSGLGPQGQTLWGLGDSNVYNILVSIDFTLNLGGNFLII